MRAGAAAGGAAAGHAPALGESRKRAVEVQLDVEVRTLTRNWYTSLNFSSPSWPCGGGVRASVDRIGRRRNHVIHIILL
jgi:hypothetical protein